MEPIQAKSILSKLKDAPDSWFGITYNMNLYRGCQHQCIYCDSRSECYKIDDFAKIRYKENALELLQKELKSKKERATIGTGSMNDPYMPVEKELGLTRKALQLVSQYKFPVHIITKSNLVLRDTDILQQISNVYASVSITITTTDDQLGRIIEPVAPNSSERFGTIRQLSQKGIYCGVLMMPILPMITDQPENITDIITKAKTAGAKYILASMGVTLRDRQREYYYSKLDKHFPGLKEKYMSRYKEQYSCPSPESKVLNSLFESKCKELGIPFQMRFYKADKPEQLKLF
jgi:DNA repair photolyase